MDVFYARIPLWQNDLKRNYTLRKRALDTAPTQIKHLADGNSRNDLRIAANLSHPYFH